MSDAVEEYEKGLAAGTAGLQALLFWWAANPDPDRDPSRTPPPALQLLSIGAGWVAVRAKLACAR